MQQVVKKHSGKCSKWLMLKTYQAVVKHYGELPCSVCSKVRQKLKVWDILTSSS